MKDTQCNTADSLKTVKYGFESGNDKKDEHVFADYSVFLPRVMTYETMVISKQQP